jgi:ribokinase
LYHDGKTTLHTPVIAAGKVVDTTGAGDAFNGGFAVALAEGMSIETALRFASATAGISVTRPGTAGSMPTRAEIEAVLG